MIHYSKTRLSLACSLLAALLVCVAAGPPNKNGPPAPHNTIDLYAQGAAALDAQNFTFARMSLLDFVTASVGDPRLDNARKMLAKAWLAEADQLFDQGCYEEAFNCWGDFSRQFANDPNASDAKIEAGKKVDAVLPTLQREQKFAPAIELINQFAKYFPGDSPLATPDMLRSYETGELAQAIHNHMDPEALNALLELTLQRGITAANLDEEKIDYWNIRLACCQEMIQHNELQRSIDYANKWWPGSPPDTTNKWNKMLSDAMFARADCCGKFGNKRMFQFAINAIKDSPLPAIYKVRLTSLQTLAAGPPPKQHVLNPADAIEAEGKWLDDGAGYTLDGTLVIRKNANITVMPGFVLDGGTINIKRGQLEASGVPGRPVIFRNVNFHVELGGTLIGKNAIFENCTFEKAGGFFSHYSSHWEFHDCLMFHSNFAGLNGIDYGVKAATSVFVECKFPQRQLCEDPPTDMAKTYRDTENQINEDAFIRCKLAPSFTWATQACYFEQCTLDEPEGFRSTTNLQVQMAMHDNEMDFARHLAARSYDQARGRILFAAAAVPTIKTRDTPALALIGAAPSDKKE